MPTLPSFVELMASLGLENTDSDSCPRSLRPSPSVPLLPHFPVRPLNGPATTPSMPTIVTSDHDAPSSRNLELDPTHSGSAQRIRRYTPYSPRISHVRNRSVPAPFSSEGFEGTNPSRPMSTSPRLSEARSRPKDNARRRASTLHSTETIAGTPISTFVRRKTPSASPTSPNFPSRSVRTPPADPAAPVSLPRIPPLPPMPYTYAPTLSNSEIDTIPRTASGSPPSSDWHQSRMHLNSHRSRHVTPVA